MRTDAERIDSSSVGDPARHHSLDHLERELAALPTAPPSVGRVALLVCRGQEGCRVTPEQAHLTPSSGMPGDKWGQQPEPLPEAQLAVMQADVAALIANDQPLTLFGDQLFLDLDLSAANLPIGSVVRVGGALMVVTPKAHNGCRKFQARFGPDALRFVSKPDLRPRNLRGIYLRVVAGGDVAIGDRVEVVSRAVPTPSDERRTMGALMTKREMEELWAEHIRHEFVTKDVEATLATMVEDATVNHMPVDTGGTGKTQLRAFYRDVFIGSWPADLQMTVTNRVFGDNQLVEENHLRFTHSNRMEWFLPGVAPTNRVVDTSFIIVIQFRDGKLACERIYWDQAGVLRQVGLLPG